MSYRFKLWTVNQSAISTIDIEFYNWLYSLDDTQSFKLGFTFVEFEKEEHAILFKLKFGNDCTQIT